MLSESRRILNCTNKFLDSTLNVGNDNLHLRVLSSAICYTALALSLPLPRVTSKAGRGKPNKTHLLVVCVRKMHPGHILQVK
jgi:hypothetical protein